MTTNTSDTVHYLPERHRGPCNIGPDERRMSCGAPLVPPPEDLPLGSVVYGGRYTYSLGHVTCPACLERAGHT